LGEDQGQQEGDYGFEFSVVRASDFRSIDSGNSSLKWYRFDNNSSIEITIP
jgi:hypothetical protein